LKNDFLKEALKALHYRYKFNHINHYDKLSKKAI
jgi:hypothetical protein